MDKKILLFGIVILLLSVAVFADSPYPDPYPDSNPYGAVMIFHFDNSTGSNASSIFVGIAIILILMLVIIAVITYNKFKKEKLKKKITEKVKNPKKSKPSFKWW